MLVWRVYRACQNLTYGNIYNLAKPNIRGYIGQGKLIYTCNIQKEHLQTRRGFWYLRYEVGTGEVIGVWGYY